AGMWISADGAAADHAAGRVGSSFFGELFVDPALGTVDGQCVLRIGSDVYIDADGDPDFNIIDGDIDIDASGPFTLGCRRR
ncbi:MAG: hypothetical protein ABMA25_18565, partial [Ilumatobacteraceae bacterium]